MTRSRHTGYDAAVEAADSDDSERLAYEEALRLLMGLPDFERSMNQPGHSGFHLERMRLILDRLGSPHLAAPAVHVAGTDGKGSTAAMVTSILGATGHKVGLYTSPHLHSVTERIRIGMEPIGRADFAALLRRLWPHVLWVEREGQHGPMSFFEMMTAMAFEHFRERGVDFQVVEVGLGGRLDSTNVVEPEVSVITPVSLDHVATLGSTLPLIAAEKAGIIKSGTPIVMAPQREEAAEVVRRVASERSAPLKEVASALTWQTIEADAAGTRFRVDGAHESYESAHAATGRAPGRERRDGRSGGRDPHRAWLRTAAVEHSGRHRAAPSGRGGCRCSRTRARSSWSTALTIPPRPAGCLRPCAHTSTSTALYL